MADWLTPILSIGAGLLGNQQANDQAKGAADELQRIKQMYQNIVIPSIEDQKLNLQNYNVAGTYAPQTEAAQQLAAHDALQDVNLDPRLKQAQQQQLDTLRKIAGSGFTQDELLSAQAQRDKNESDVTARLKQLQQQQDMRGLGNSDLSLAQKMMEAQSGANRQAQDARSLQAEAARRSLQAIAQAGQLAGNMENTDYQRQANLAQNLNQRELANMQQRANVQRSNVDRFNDALKYNLGNQQQIANQNTSLANQQQIANKGLYQQQFQNQMSKAGGMSGVGTNIANNINNAAHGTRDMYAGIAKGIGQMGAALTQPEKNKKLDFEEQ